MRSWSFSALQIFETCPLQYRFRYIDKIPVEIPQEAMERGRQIHQQAENYVNGIEPFSENLRHFQPDFLALRQKYEQNLVSLEEEWAFAENWRPTDWKSGWLRLKCDAVAKMSPYHLAVIDYKTGKKFGNEIKHARQMALYALSAFIRYPTIKKITCELWYLDKNELSRIDISSTKVKPLLAEWDKKGKNLTNTDYFPANPGQFNCKWCPYAANCASNPIITTDKKADEGELSKFKRRI